MNLLIRSPENAIYEKGTLSPSQNKAVLIAGLVCSSISLITTFITLRWFLLMKRSFRHQLIFYLIISDTFKAIWYFVFPIVLFSQGRVASASRFCQASGFFLALGVEGSDVAIFFIALHSILYIFRPPTRSGSGGGLYNVRYWIPVFLIGLPLLAASLAFVNSGNAYVTSGTFCYLPKRPYWYRLALAWIPRYMIITTIFGMYIAVYIYVSIKFHGFGHLAESEENYGSTTGSRSSSVYESSTDPEESNDIVRQQTPEAAFKKYAFGRPALSRGGSQQNLPNLGPKNSMAEPWDNVAFITTRPLQENRFSQPGIDTADFAGHGANTSDVDKITSDPKRYSSRQPSLLSPDIIAPHEPESRKESSTPTINTCLTGETITNTKKRHLSNKATNLYRTRSKDPLHRTRSAIRKQLRYMFIYPLVYVLMWVFPFVSHCLLYDDYFATHPIFWLSVTSTCMLALQASADCIVFSWREKPWRRVPDDSRFSVSYWRRRSKDLMEKPRDKQGSNSSTVRNPDGSIAAGADTEMAGGNTSRAPSTLWWEAEGRKRKDSVWLGVDLQNVASRVSEKLGQLTEDHTNNESDKREDASSSRSTSSKRSRSGSSKSRSPTSRSPPHEAILEEQEEHERGNEADDKKSIH